MEPLHVILYGTASVVVFSGMVGAVVVYIVKPIKTAAARIASVATLTDKVDCLIGITNAQTGHIVVMQSSMRAHVRATRSIGYAMKEHGWNGSTDRILQHTDDAEDLINGAAAKSSEERMTAACE